MARPILISLVIRTDTHIQKIRTTISNHKLPIKVRNWCKSSKENMVCQCQEGHWRYSGDEFHYIFECPRFVKEESLIYDLNKETDKVF